MSDEVVLTHKTRHGRGVRHRYEPMPEGYAHIEEVLTLGDDWREVGREPVKSVSIETPE